MSYIPQPYPMYTYSLTSTTSCESNILFDYPKEVFKCQYCGQYGEDKKPCPACGAPIEEVKEKFKVICASPWKEIEKKNWLQKILHL